MKMNSKMTAAGTLLAGLELLSRPPARTQVSIGEIFTVGTPASNPPGSYTRTFYITFNLE